MLTAAGAVITCFAPEAALSGLGLFLVGVGWSGSYVGATAVISDFTRLTERGTALGFTDLLSASASGVGAFGGGIVLERSGFPAVGAAMAVLVVPATVLLLSIPRAAWRGPVAKATSS